MTTILAQIIGPIAVAAAIALLVRPKSGKQILEDFEANEGLTYTIGILTMVVGLLIVLNHNIWNSPEAIIITVMGWGSIIKGVAFLIVPNLLFRFSKVFLKNTVFQVSMFFVLALGVYLSYFGYFMSGQYLF